MVAINNQDKLLSLRLRVTCGMQVTSGFIFGIIHKLLSSNERRFPTLNVRLLPRIVPDPGYHPMSITLYGYKVMSTIAS